MSSQEPSPVQAAVSAAALSDRDAEASFGPFRALAVHLLGEAPFFTNVAHSSPLTTVFYFACLRPCVHIPAVDLMLNPPLSTHHRRLAMLRSSQTHGCSYCMGHTAALGDVLSGPFPAQCALAGVSAPFAKAAPGDQALSALVRAVCSLPADATSQLKTRFVDAFSPTAFEYLVDIVCYTGWLNFVMDALGMQLEPGMMPFAKQALSSDASDSHSDSGSDAAVDAASAGTCGAGGIKETVRRAGRLAALLPSVARAQLREAAFFRGVPAGGERLDVWVEQTVGVLPRVVQGACSDVAKRALALGLRELVGNETCSAWSVGERVTLMYVFGRRVRNGVLADDAVRVLAAVRDAGRERGGGEAAGGAEGAARGALEDAYAAARGAGGTAGTRFEAASRFVFACAGGGAAEAVQTELVRWVDDAAMVVDLAGMLGLFAFAHRLQVFSALE